MNAVWVAPMRVFEGSECGRRAMIGGRPGARFLRATPAGRCWAPVISLGQVANASPAHCRMEDARRRPCVQTVHAASFQVVWRTSCPESGQLPANEARLGLCEVVPGAGPCCLEPAERV